MPKQQNKAEISPVAIWGKVITQLRTNNMGALFIACGEIDEVLIENKTFIICANQNNKLLLDVPQNFKIIQEILQQLLPGYDILVKEILPEESPREVAKQKLKQLFGDKLTIIGEKKLWQ